MNTTLRFAADKDMETLHRLWTVCFPGDERFAEHFFKRLYRPEQALAVFDEYECALAMLHILPREVSLFGHPLQAGYIYGVGTHPEHRRKGLARDLLDQAFFQLHLRGVPLAMLIPQERWLFDFYAPFGFRPVGRQQILETELSLTGHEITDIPRLNNCYETHFAAVPHVLRSREVWEVILEEVAMAAGRCYETSGGGYALMTGQKVMEAAGPGVESYIGPAMGCVRIIEATVLRNHAEKYNPELSLPASAPDAWCPWNRSEDNVEGAIPLEDVLFHNCYMDLMHN